MFEMLYFGIVVKLSGNSDPAVCDFSISLCLRGAICVAKLASRGNAGCVRVPIDEFNPGTEISQAYRGATVPVEEIHTSESPEISFIIDISDSLSTTPGHNT